MAGRRVAELEVLYTADTAQVAKAEKDVKASGERIEKKPIQQKIGADTKDAISGMDRVEEKAKRLVSRETSLKLDADIVRAEQNLARTNQRLEDLQVRALGGLDVTADVRRAEAALSRTQRHLDGLRTARTEIQVEANPADAIAGMDRVERKAKEVVSQRFALRINTDIATAYADIDKLEDDLKILRTRETSPRVDADIARAEAKLRSTRRQLTDLEGARATMVVDVNEGGAKQKLSDVADYAGAAGEEGGEAAGANLSDGIVAALVSIPIAGAIVGVGVAAGKALLDGVQEGLGQEASRDRLGALTGIDEVAALRLGRAAGEAYANVFGESVESNMDTTRIGLQFGIIDANATTTQAQKVVQGLSGIADALDEDVRPVATATTTLLKTGLATSAQAAFDIIAAGLRNGVNRGDDLLDTLTEYPAVVKRLGLDGAQFVGLLNQSLAAGARNSDVAADALKEFQIRATDSSDASAAGFQRLGMNAEKMTAKIARGGDDAREGLQEVLIGLREMEDPVQRNLAAVELFGTKAEDLGEALFAMDLSSAVDQLDGVTGSAQRMFDRLADNDATKMEQAKRNVEVAMQGIQGALAAGLSEPLGQAAEWVSENRGPVLQFLLDMANGAFDFGVSLVESTADGTEALGEFISGPGADMVKFLGDLTGSDDLRQTAEDMRGFKDEAAESADRIRDIIPRIEEMRGKVNEFGEGAVAIGFLNDASLRLADTLAQVGVDADGAALSLDEIDGSNLRASESGRILREQVRDTMAALADEVNAAAAAGEGQDALKERYDATTAALLGQLEQMGLTREEAQALIDVILQTPVEAYTGFGSNAVAEQTKVQSLADRITTLPDGSVVIMADPTPAENAIDGLISRYTGNTIQLRLDGTPIINGVPQVGRAHGGSVFGPGTETSDSINARLSHNEHVVTAHEVRGFGGHAGLERLRRYAAAGRLGELLPGFRGGGPVVERRIGAQAATLAASSVLGIAPSPGGDLPAAIASAIVAALGGMTAGKGPAGKTVHNQFEVFALPGMTPQQLIDAAIEAANFEARRS